MAKKKEPLTDQDVSSELNKFNLFVAIPELVSKYGKGTIIFSLLVVFLIVNLIISPINFEKILEKWEARTEMEHRAGLEKRKQADIVIPSMLSALLYKVDADRILLLELHNGGTNKSNLPFYHFTATYEVVNEDNLVIEYISDQYRNQNTGDYGPMLEELSKVKCIYYEDINLVEDSKFIRKLTKNNVQSIHLNPIFSDDGEIIAILSIASSTPCKFNHVRLQQLTMLESQKIGHLLSGINNTKK